MSVVIVASRDCEKAMGVATLKGGKKNPKVQFCAGTLLMITAP